MINSSVFFMSNFHTPCVHFFDICSTFAPNFKTMSKKQSPDGRVLVVDDNKAILSALRLLLPSYFAEVTLLWMTTRPYFRP